MKSRSKSNNFFALLIAAALMAIGFALFFAHKQSTFNEAEASNESTEPVSAELQSATDESLSEVALIHAEIGAPPTDQETKTEFELIRESIDFSDAPLPAPVLVKGENYDVYTKVSKEFLAYYFDKLGYNGEKIDSGETEAIPPLLVVSIGQGWSKDITVQFKKSLFYRVILSLVLYENDAVLRQREKLETILNNRSADGNFSAEQTRSLNKLALSYKVIKEESDEALTEAQIQELLSRVDMVSPSLALAQAAHESGYATSRFAHSANALFGQWAWGEDAVKPEQQRKGMGNYGIKAFDQPVDSVRSYIRNLNTHNAYAEFRKVRAAQRGGQKGRVVMDGKSLADTLLSYSERGAEYTKELKSTISYNRLERADSLRLMEGEPIYFQGR